MNGVNSGIAADPKLLIERLDFLADVPPLEVQYLFAGAVKTQTLNQRNVLFVEGESMDHIYYVIEGTIEQIGTVYQKDGSTGRGLNRRVGKGRLLGHFDLIFEQPYSTRARALENSTVLQIETTALKRLLQRYPHLGAQMIPVDTMRRLRTMPLFAGVDLTTVGFIAEACTRETWSKGERIYRAGDPFEQVYLLNHGQVHQIWVDGREAWLGNGAVFGIPDSALYSSWSQAIEVDHEARAMVVTSAFAIGRDILDAITGTSYVETKRTMGNMREQTLADLPIFNRLRPSEAHLLAGFVSHYRIPINHVIMQQGEVGDSLWVLLPGGRAILHALDQNGQALPNVHVKGMNFFGEKALQVQLPMDSTVEAEQESQWLRLHWSDYRAFLKRAPKDVESRIDLDAQAQELLQAGATRERYPWLAPGEILVTFQKRHWIALLRKTFLPILLLSGALMLTWYLLSTGSTDTFWLNCLTASLLVFALAWLAWGILDYNNDYLLVTNQRVVRQEKVVALAEHQQVALLERIENVDFSSTLVGRIFGYGEIVIRTAGTEGAIRFDYVPRPVSIQGAILGQISVRQRHHSASSKLVIQRVLEERLGLTLDLPSRVVVGTDAGDHMGPTSLWQRVLAFVNIGQHMQMRDNDRIVWRKHWAVLVGHLIAPMALLIATLLIAIGLFAVVRNFLQASGLAVELIAAGFGLFAICWMAWEIADWRNDRYEVTDTHVADIEKLPLFFAENRRTASLGQIQNIDLDIPTPFNYLLNYGNVKLQTAAEQGDFTFDWVPDPREVADELRRRIDQFHRREQEEQARQQAKELPDWFETYNRLENDIGRRTM